VPAAWNYSASTASGVLTAIVGAMIALIGFVVTIGVVVVQQATSTLSPRYMRLWYRDRLQKAALATFAGTFTFAYSLLRRVEDDHVPNVGVTVAGIAVAVSIGVLLIYLDRFTHNLRPVAVAALVGQSGQQVLATRSPQFRGHDTTPAAVPDLDAPVQVVLADRAGAVQAVDLQAMVTVAQRHASTIVLTRSIGDFVTPGTTLVEVHGAALPGGGKQLRGLFALGRERTIEQDPAFALRILVDIAIKALSPAINDPTTAVQVLDHIEAFVEVAARTDLHDWYALTDRDGAVRVVIPGRAWADYLELAVTEIRDYGATSTQVCRRLRALLDGLLATVPLDRQSAVRDELYRLDTAVEAAFPDPVARSRARGSDRQGVGRSRPGRRTTDRPPGSQQ
jgi:uncharacterized membrane protein